MTTERDVWARPAAVLTVGLTALLTGAGVGALAHAVTAYEKRNCAAADAVSPESMCGLGVIVWGPVVTIAAAPAAGCVMWLVLAVSGIEPRRRLLGVAFFVPVVLVEPFGFAARASWPAFLVVAPASGVAQALIALGGQARFTRS